LHAFPSVDLAFYWRDRAVCTLGSSEQRAHSIAQLELWLESSKRARRCSPTRERAGATTPLRALARRALPEHLPRPVLTRLPGRKLGFSNTGALFASGLALLRVADIFDGIFCIEQIKYLPRPDRRGFFTCCISSMRRADSSAIRWSCGPSSERPDAGLLQANSQIDELLSCLGKKVAFVEGMLVTEDETMDSGASAPESSVVFRVPTQRSSHDALHIGESIMQHNGPFFCGHR
jgi:hypothetical protein